MEPSLNSWTIVFFVAATQGVFLSAMIFLRKSRANNLLSWLILSFSICLFYYVSYWTGYSRTLHWSFGILQGLTYTFGPLIYFYIRSSKKEIHWNWLHLMPFFLYAFFFLGIPSYGANTRLLITIQNILQNAHLIIYTILSVQFVNNNKAYTNGALKQYKWRKKLAWSFSGYTLSFVSYYVLVWTGTLKIEYDYMISLASTFFIYFIGYHGFQKQEVFKMVENGRYQKSSLNQSASQSIYRSIIRLIDDEEIYLDSALRLQDLAKKLDLSTHHISQVINDVEGKNFADFINSYRVNKAKEMLSIENDTKIIQVAYACGFNNKNSFHNAFKRITNMSPSEYRERHLVIA